MDTYIELSILYSKLVQISVLLSFRMNLFAIDDNSGYSSDGFGRR